MLGAYGQRLGSLDDAIALVGPGTGHISHRERDLDAISDALNGRPRETLEWVMTAEEFAELVAMTG